MKVICALLVCLVVFYAVVCGASKPVTEEITFATQTNGTAVVNYYTKGELADSVLIQPYDGKLHFRHQLEW